MSLNKLSIALFMILLATCKNRLSDSSESNLTSWNQEEDPFVKSLEPGTCGVSHWLKLPVVSSVTDLGELFDYTGRKWQIDSTTKQFTPTTHFLETGPPQETSMNAYISSIDLIEGAEYYYGKDRVAYVLWSVVIQQLYKSKSRNLNVKVKKGHKAKHAVSILYASDDFQLIKLKVGDLEHWFDGDREIQGPMELGDDKAFVEHMGLLGDSDYSTFTKKGSAYIVEFSLKKRRYSIRPLPSKYASMAFFSAKVSPSAKFAYLGGLVFPTEDPKQPSYFHSFHHSVIDLRTMREIASQVDHGGRKIVYPNGVIIGPRSIGVTDNNTRQERILANFQGYAMPYPADDSHTIFHFYGGNETQQDCGIFEIRTDLKTASIARIKKALCLNKIFGPGGKNPIILAHESQFNSFIVSNGRNTLISSKVGSLLKDIAIDPDFGVIDPENAEFILVNLDAGTGEKEDSFRKSQIFHEVEAVRWRRFSLPWYESKDMVTNLDFALEKKHVALNNGTTGSKYFKRKKIFLNTENGIDLSASLPEKIPVCDKQACAWQYISIGTTLEVQISDLGKGSVLSLIMKCKMK